VSWTQASLLWGAVCLISLVLTHALRALIRRNGWLSLPPAALLTRVAIAIVVSSSITYAVSLAMSEWVYGTAVSPLARVFYQRLSPGGQLRNQFVFMLIVHIAWVALYLAFAMQRHRYRTEIQQAQLGQALRAAELRLLQSQLNPHFLFNALNGLRSLIADEPARAREAVTRLARLLRQTLASSDENLVSLERELELVEDYLSLESMRLADRLTVERDIDTSARTARVPAMLLQTLVENAIKHGIAELKQGGTLRLTAKVLDQELLLRVDNPCPHPRVAPPASNGVGLRNASERLRLLFGARASLRLEFADPGRAVAEARIPMSAPC
jgi:LytS/YehU family sensor histidine kinase